MGNRRLLVRLAASTTGKLTLAHATRRKGALVPAGLKKRLHMRRLAVPVGGQQRRYGRPSRTWSLEQCRFPTGRQPEQHGLVLYGLFWEERAAPTLEKNGFGICDASSQTGCSDRLPSACMSWSGDRCDGDVRIGCDGAGKVSFHDCARIEGATCGELADGKLGCVALAGSECASGTYTCQADAVVLCISGKKVQVPASYLGLSSCSDGQL
jgi:hypothetical protein